MCAAAIDGDASRWADAQAAAAHVDGGEGTTGCLADAAKALLARALAWHHRHPDGRPKVALPEPGGTTACPFHLSTVAVVDDDGHATGGALEGPVTGGTHLAILGVGLTGEPVVAVGGSTADIVGTTDGGLIISTPAVTAPIDATITVHNDAGTLTASAHFHYVAAAGSPTPTS